MILHRFTMAFPDVPWVYVYRDSVEIMQSHMKNGIENIISGGRGRGRTSSSNSNPPVCGRNYRLPYNKQPSTTLEIIQNSLKGVTGREYSSTIQKDLNIIEYCAAHIAGLSLSAIKEYYRHSDGGSGGGDSSQEVGQKGKRTSTSTSTSTNGTNSMGRFVNYSDMPEIVWNDIIPNHFNIDITNKNVYRSAMKNMENTALVYSKGGRGSKKANMEFKEDSTKKQSTAPQEVIDAVELFTVDTYNTMKSISYNHNHK
jgi:molecular chaperone DnaK (HSP70)